MNLIIDANIVMSALICMKGKTCELICNEKIKLFTPDLLLKEINNHKEEILLKSGISKKEFDLFLSIITSKIILVEYNKFKEHVSLAKEITPDPKDTEYFALALTLNHNLWSNDKRLKQQNKVKVYSTQELLKLIK